MDIGRNNKKGGNPSTELYAIQLLNRILAVIGDIDKSGLALESTQLTQNTELISIDNRLTPGLRTHNTVVATGAGSIPVGSIRGSVFNAGSAVGVWNGISLPTGVGVPWEEVGNRDTYAAIDYDATGTTFLIEYTM